MLQFRIFISSPSDASIERRRTENVVSRLNGEIAGLARLTSVRWESEHYRAHETFQTQIPPAADCEIVVGVLKWRLGTALPPGFDSLPNGEPYPSGTAYELLTAIEKRRAGGPLPDVFVFRYAGGSPHPALDDPRRADIEHDWSSLRGFFERWFLTPEGHFLAALNSYKDEDDFEEQLETLLRKWLAEKVAGGRVVPWPATKGSPFRGLGVFGARHAPVFFGRAGDIRRAGDLWRDYAAKGTKFLLIVGASGAGKSSLARAGLIPRLITPGVVPDVDQWRIAVMRPGDSPAGPFQALAAALLQSEASLPPEEDGRGPALPEIAEGDSKTPAELAQVLSHADAGAIRPLTNALARIGERAKAADQYGREIRCDLVLLIDQLEELFAPSMPADVRARFAALIASLVSTGRVWLVATLRADLYASMLEVDVLKALKDIGASYDLTPPGAAELAEIVRAPAEAAALTFETDPATGERLDERLLREADRSDMLPLVQLALSRLWEARESRDGATVLPIAAFEKLGGVKGIVQEAGEAALAKLGEAERARLPPLIRRLAELTHATKGAPGTLTARAVPLDEVSRTAVDKTLVDALVAARLLKLHSAGGVTTVRLSHQRVLTDWARAAAIVGESAGFYRVRDDVESQRLRWEAARRSSEFLLVRGLPLAEARKMAATYANELAPETHAYINASQRRATRAQAFGWAAAAVFAVFAVGAGVAAKFALDQKAQAEIERQEAETQRAQAQAQRKEALAQKAQAEKERRWADAQTDIAQHNFSIAKKAVDKLAFGVVRNLTGLPGVRVDTIRQIQDVARDTSDQLMATSPDDPNLAHSRAIMLDDFENNYAEAGDLKNALSAATEALTWFRKFAAQEPNDTTAQRDLAISAGRFGRLKLAAGGDREAALTAYREALAIYRRLAAQHPGDLDGQREISVALDNLADAQNQLGYDTDAVATYQEALAIDRKLFSIDGNTLDQRNLAISIEKVGNAKLKAEDRPGALADYNESLAIYRKLAKAQPDDPEAQRDLAIGLEHIGNIKLDMYDGYAALELYNESVAIYRALAAPDPSNAEEQRDLAIGIEKVGSAYAEVGNQTDAMAAYQDDVTIYRQLAVKDPTNAEAQRDLATAIGRIGNLKLQAANPTAALKLYDESLDLYRKLATLKGNGLEAQRDLAISLDKVSDAKKQSGDPAGALTASKEALVLYRKLAKDRNSQDAQSELVDSLGNTAYAALTARDYATALALSDEAIALAPTAYWLYINRASALMLLGRTDDARTLFLKYRGETSRGTTPWERAVRFDFAAFRNLGIANPLMDEIEADFAKPQDAASGRR